VPRASQSAVRRFIASWIAVGSVTGGRDEIGALLLRSVRGSDIVCRFGGEEFVWVFFDCSIDKALPRLGQLARDMKDMQCTCRGKPLPCVTVSIGVAQYPQHAQTFKGVIRAADQALYIAKNTGRDRIEAAA
jgi:diguanylate cyclase (GGDEF)-like protein